MKHKRIFTAEHRANMSKAKTGVKRKPFTEAHKKKIAAKRAAAWALLNENERKHTPEWNQKISASTSGENHYLFNCSHRAETILKMSLAKRGKKHHLWGKKHSEETKRRMKIAQRKRHARNKIA